MSNKSLQEERVKGYFIQAAKEIIKSEGIKGLSVRNVAEKAGYSYATIYNYFRDARVLIFMCVNDFCYEIEEFCSNETKNIIEADKKLQAKVKAYTKFFIQYPGIFELLFVERMNDITTHGTAAEQIFFIFDKVCLESLTQLNIKPENIEFVEFKDAVHGSLLFMMNRKMPVSYTEFTNKIDLFCSRFMAETAKYS